MKQKGFHDSWIGVDLDGTLAHYDEYRGDDHVGQPIPEMVKKVNEWLDEGYDVRIFTARKPHPAIRKFSKENFGRILPITNKKDPGMIALFDDRVVGVERNTGKIFSNSNLKQVEL